MSTLLCIIIGLCSGGCGISYKIGSLGKIYPIQGSTVLSLIGTFYFGFLAHAEWSHCTWQVVLTGAIFGLTQYLGIRLLRMALQRGPLSPAWCAQAMNFVPAIIYSAKYLGETLKPLQYGAIAATVCAILAASFGADGGNKANSKKQVFTYGLLLVGILLSLSVINIGMKFCTAYCVPGEAAPMMQQTGKLIMTFTYLFLGLAGATELTIKHHWLWNRYAVLCSAGVTFCALTAYTITVSIVCKVPAVTLFSVNYATSILTASLSSVFFFRERKSLAWCLTVGFAVLAIILNR